jgi:hypothetical protein
MARMLLKRAVVKSTGEPVLAVEHDPKTETVDIRRPARIMVAAGQRLPQVSHEWVPASTLDIEHTP